MKKKVFSILTVLLILFCITSYADEDTYIVKFKNAVQLYKAHQDPRDTYTEATWEQVREYIELGIVEYYEPNLKAVLYTGDTAESTDIFWNMKNTNADFTKKLNANGKGVIVGVIDSGLNESMVDCNTVAGYDFHEKTGNVSDEAGHGTIVSSLIAFRNYGIADECTIVPLKCFYYDSNKKDYNADAKEIADAIYAAIEDYKCDVINMSFGIIASSEEISTNDNLKTLRDAVNYAAEKGVIMVAACGNSGGTSLSYPAAFENVIGVGAIDENNIWWEKSQYNESVFAVAPGVEVPVILKSEAGNGLYKASGTSFAAPHVSALAAVVKSLKPDTDVLKFKELLTDTCTDLGEEKWDEKYGHGIINFKEAFKRYLDGKPFYISPVSFKEENNGTISVVGIYNNTEEYVNATIIYANYDSNNTLTDRRIKEINMAPEQVLNPCALYDSGTVKYMLWGEVEKLKPLTECAVKKK